MQPVWYALGLKDGSSIEAVEASNSPIHQFVQYMTCRATSETVQDIARQDSGAGLHTIRPEQDPHTTRPHWRQWCLRSPLGQYPNLFPHCNSEHSSASWSGCQSRRGTWRAPTA